MIVSAHAAQRWIERVNPAATVSEARAQIAMHDRAVTCAAGFGCTTVRLGNGAKLILDGDEVVTVLAAAWRSTQSRQSRGAFA